ncbi:response regulator with CheY-like receiver, AAA-type ATPase, and DNA-binding domains [Beggiatoa alba B18LD]|uniref:Response regulator with CheY-like receiver, AAA-type ATPase, and DNA-binding domains n=1 Tax=Beggiatoa alba B18LD TaxID=395493 RepID=I3CBK7_9GAMM|nr:response regulator [Beggiatoa alba]EIJ41000.1 response regulator with CheY-like receiver, AAA-type ATPase, and DNA-binding domains [Beggiatoa alba B18LD]
MSKSTLLLVDDEERILRSLKMLFLAKYRVLSTTDGNEALEILKKETVHVIISDQRMPIMLGVDLLRQAKEIAPNTMRLLLTGYSDLQAIVGSVNEGEIFRYINKPWQTEELKATVDKAVEIALKLEQLHQAKTTDTVAIMPTPVLGQAPHVMVIDNDEAIYKEIHTLLSATNPTHWATSLDEAFNILNNKPIGVVISEIELNGEDITASIKTLKQCNPNILTVVLTSFQDTKALIGLINHGQVYRFLPKPIHKSLLARSLEATLKHYQVLHLKPQLLMRHAVEPTKTEEQQSLSSRVLGFIRKLRNRPAQQPTIN